LKRNVKNQSNYRLMYVALVSKYQRSLTYYVEYNNNTDVTVVLMLIKKKIKTEHDISLT
jgi:hypothetical protein